jgi:phospholipid/cholesterol/gamma-HCH transport system ATP-binding protein
MGPSKISLRGVTKAFGPKKVLQGIDLEVTPGESMVVIGGSGTGKSVLLKCILGLMQPDDGSIKIDGVETVDLGDHGRSQVMRKFGMLFQGGALFDSLRVWENVAFGPIQSDGMATDKARDVAIAKLGNVGLGPEIGELFPSELSGGMQKRVALARAIAREPEIIFFDEPTTGLDPIMTDVINELILQTRKQHSITSIVVTHEMKTVAKCADRVVMLYPLGRLQPGENQVLFDATPADLLACPDPRVRQFVEGEARDRLQELARQEGAVP